MSAQDTLSEAEHVRLNEDNIAYLMNLLRNATQPVTTQQLIDALRRQSGQQPGADAANREALES